MKKLLEIQTGEEPQGLILFATEREASLFEAKEHPWGTYTTGWVTVRSDQVRPSQTHRNGFRYTDAYFDDDPDTYDEYGVNTKNSFNTQTFDK